MVSEKLYLYFFFHFLHFSHLFLRSSSFSSFSSFSSCVFFFLLCLLSAFFLGGHPRLSPSGLNVLYRDAWESRMELVTVPSGTVYLQVDVLLRNVNEENMKWLL